MDSIIHYILYEGFARPWSSVLSFCNKLDYSISNNGEDQLSYIQVYYLLTLSYKGGRGGHR